MKLEHTAHGLDHRPLPAVRTAEATVVTLSAVARSVADVWASQVLLGAAAIAGMTAVSLRRVIGGIR